MQCAWNPLAHRAMTQSLSGKIWSDDLATIDIKPLEKAALRKTPRRKPAALLLVCGVIEISAGERERTATGVNYGPVESLK